MSKSVVNDGVLPKGWRKMRLGDVSQFSKGNGITKDEVITEGIPCVRYGELYTKHNFRINDFYSFISDTNSCKHKLIKNNDLLFAGSGETREEIGKCASFHHTIKAYAGGDVIICSIDPKILRADFASYYLNTIGRRQINKLGQGDSIVHIYSRYLENVEIPVPPLTEQKAISSVLETWDTAIEKTEAFITAKQKRFEWLLKILIADNCSQWKHYKSMNLFESLSRRGYSNEQLLSATQSQGVVPRSTLEGRVMSPYGGTEGYKLVQPGDFTISLRSFQGGIEYSDYRGVISPAYTVLTPVREIVNDFYRYFFKSYIFIEKYLSLAVVGIREGKQINVDDFKTIKIPYPPLKHQEEIANTLNIARLEIDVLKQLTDRYHTQTRGLMHKLLTGKLKVT